MAATRSRGQRDAQCAVVGPGVNGFALLAPSSNRSSGVNRKQVEGTAKYMEDSATHLGRVGSNLAEIRWAASASS